MQYLNQSKYEPMVLYHKIRKMLLQIAKIQERKKRAVRVLDAADGVE